MSDENAIVVHNENKDQALAAVRNTGGQLASLPSPAELKKRLDLSLQYRELFNEHIKLTFRKWDHYYRYHFYKACKIYHCENPDHISGSWEITANGAKKLLQDFTLFPDYKLDEESKKIFGDPQGLVCLICFIYTIDGKFFASGRGSDQIGPYSDANRTMKMSQKKALIDALKSSGMLADFEQIIQSIEGEPVQHLHQPTEEVVETKTVNGKNKCEYCASVSSYHAKHCPNYKG